MSYISTTINACPNLQRELTDAFQMDSMGLFIEPLPLLEFLTSPANSTNLAQSVAPGRGKKRTVQVRYDQRIAESAVQDDQTNPQCTTGNEVGDMLKEYEIDITDNVQLTQSVQITDLSDSCVENSAYFNRLYLRMMDAVERKLATKHIADLAALNGTWEANVADVNGSNQLVVKTYKDSSIDPYPYTFQTIDRALRQTGFDSAVMFSGSLLYDYYLQMQTGCCADNGINLMEQMGKYGKAVIFDKRYESAYGTDLGVAIKPKSLALLHWTFAGWQEGVDPKFYPSNTGFKTTVFGLRTGIPMDLNVHESSCGSYVNVSITATTKLVGLPDDMFQDGDDFDGVTFVNEIKVTNV